MPVLLLEPFCALFQVVDDPQMLRACAFALTALNAVGCLSFAIGRDAVLADLAETLVVVLSVGDGEDIRNGNTHRAAFHAVAASGAGDGLVRIERILGFRPAV